MKDATTEKVAVMEQGWDYLIILDACRYDYFKRLYSNYFQGKLSKKISIGTATSEWRDKSFTRYYDNVIYISANPYINSIAPVKGFNAKKHFEKIYDLWLENWDNERGTVLPKTVTKRAAEIIRNNPDKKAIVHYIQPHEPYLGPSIKCPGFERPEAGDYLHGVMDRSLKQAIMQKFMKIISGMFYWVGIRGYYTLWRMRELLALPPANPMDAMRRKYGLETLRKAYSENVEIALRHSAELVEKLSGRIIVTSDHGEMLGENNKFCHWSRAKEPHLREIPWLVIDNGKKTQRTEKTEQNRQDKEPAPHPDKGTQEKSDADTDRKIQQRLKNLGYY